MLLKYQGMKKCLLLVFLSGFLASCMQNNAPENREKRFENKAVKEVADFVADYLRGKLKNPALPVEEDGMMTVRGDGTGYMINLPKIVTGKIDEDNFIDAVVPVYILRGSSLMGYEHLVVLRPAGKFVVGKTMNDVFNIIGIKNRNIIAEVSTVSPDSPGYGCEECREVIHYRFESGELIRTK